MMTRAEVLRKCLIVFDALRRVSSRGNAGLEALPGAEESFRADAEICRVLREWLREMEAGPYYKEVKPLPQEVLDRLKQGSWPEAESLESLLQGNPLMTPETIEAARRVDEARDKLIEKYAGRGLAVPNGQMEPDVPKVVDLKEWQRLKTPPERMDFDE